MTDTAEQANELAIANELIGRTVSKYFDPVPQLSFPGGTFLGQIVGVEQAESAELQALDAALPLLLVVR